MYVYTLFLLYAGGDLHYHLTQRGVFSEKEVSWCRLQTNSQMYRHS